MKERPAAWSASKMDSEARKNDAIPVGRRTSVLPYLIIVLILGAMVCLQCYQDNKMADSRSGKSGSPGQQNDEFTYNHLAGRKETECPDGIVDVAIVGGGVSGMYAAWRLLKNSPSTKVVLLEADSRFGGRLFSVNLPGMPNVSADLGAMHFLDDNKTLQSFLFNSLGLKSIPFPMNTSDPRLPFLLRGRRFTMAELGDVNRVTEVYNLSPSERKFYSGPGSLYSHYTQKLVPNYDDPKLNPWVAHTSDGRLLKDLGWLQLAMLANMSDEAMRLIIDSSGFADFWDNPNAASLAVQHDAFINASTYKSFPGGMADIAKALVQELTHLGVTLKSSERVAQLQQAHDQESGSYVIVSSESDTGQTTTTCARKVILALPPNALAKIDWMTLRENLAWQSAVQPVHAMKFYLGFDRPWWRDPPTQSKSAWLYTSLPIQQVLYLGSQEDYTQPDRNVPVNRNSLLLGMYCTEQYTSLWESFSRANASMELFKGRPNPFVKGSPILPNTGRPVTTDMVRKALEEIAQLHNMDVSDIPQPYTAVLADWDSAWHWWRPGSNASQLIDDIAQLNKNEDIYICGEAFSYLQGWVEGALQSTERLLHKQFGLPPPKEMPKLDSSTVARDSWHHVRFGRFQR